jgi:hypothetical protein
MLVIMYLDCLLGVWAGRQGGGGEGGQREAFVLVVAC